MKQSTARKLTDTAVSLRLDINESRQEPTGEVIDLTFALCSDLPTRLVRIDSEAAEVLNKAILKFVLDNEGCGAFERYLAAELDELMVTLKREAEGSTE